MKLIRNKRRVLTWSLSMWCVYLAGLFELLPYVVPYLDDSSRNGCRSASF
ncbi:UNVERIFIED_ORG: hypothetical protein GGD58_004826 [Rhizobium pisi]